MCDYVIVQTKICLTLPLVNLAIVCIVCNHHQVSQGRGVCNIIDGCKPERGAPIHSMVPCLYIIHN